MPLKTLDIPHHEHTCTHKRTSTAVAINTTVSSGTVSSPNSQQLINILTCNTGTLGITWSLEHNTKQLSIIGCAFITPSNGLERENSRYNTRRKQYTYIK